MDDRKSILAVFEQVKQNKKVKLEGGRYYNKLNDAHGSECDLVIDDDYEDNQLAAVRKRQRGVRMAEEPTRLTCTWNDCNLSFENSKLYTDHILEHTYNIEEINGYYTCQFKDCTYSATTLELLIKHTSFHAYHERLKNVGDNVVERSKLPKCTQLITFEMPVIMSHYECEWEDCSRQFAVIHDFLMHIKIHINGNPKYCKKGEFIDCCWLGCRSKFTSQYKLADHVRSHTKEKIIACPTCGNMFASKTKFTDHRKRQIPMEQHSYQCSECSKLFPTERLLRGHMRSHVNHYKCNFCDMTCPKPSTLATHIRFRHWTERPYKCNLCDHSCVSKPNLDQHMTTHCAEKLMACEECDFSCRSFYGLERHYHTEHAEGFAAYECHCCQKKFNRGGHLTKHLIKKHGFSWPSGHSRFRYKRDADGFFRLQTVRYESLEVTKEMMSNRPPINTDIKYELKQCEERDSKTRSIKLMVTESGEKNVICNTDNEIIITIDDVDAQGNVIKSEVLTSQEIMTTDVDYDYNPKGVNADVDEDSDS